MSMSRRKAIHQPGTFGERVADVVARGMGSWRFVILQSGIVTLWIGLNVWLLRHPFDPYPLILLNLLFSTQAAYATPLLLMSSNRQAAKDQRRDDLEAAEVEQLLQVTQMLHHINVEQLEILKLLAPSSSSEPVGQDGRRIS